MKNLFLLFAIPFALFSCNKDRENTKNDENEINYADYGAFLGRTDNNITGFTNYKYLSFDFDEFTDTNISRLNRKGITTFAYLSVGSLETYRDYYEDYESYTFKDYDNWPEERWIDVSKPQWQIFVTSTLAKSFKERGASGIYLDNVDVYSVAKEEGLDYQQFATGLKNIIKGISNLGLKVLINGGSEFLEDMNNQNDEIFDFIFAYHQEEVFTLIDDYENNSFKAQLNEDKIYYQEIATMMKEKGKEIFLLEYSNDENINLQIAEFCKENKYHYYIATTVNLN